MNERELKPSKGCDFEVVIASCIDDPDIIGFRWELSSIHSEPDICDLFASIEMGFGKGVWTKDAVPKQKAHPGCKCKLSPRVTRIKQAGSLSYAELIHSLTPEQRTQLFPGRRMR